MQKDDVIYRQAAIDAVEASRCLNHHQNAMAALTHEHEHRHFLKMLMNLPPAQLEQCWIPVTEKLPNDDKPVLLTAELRFPDGKCRRDVCMASYDSQNRIWYEILGANILEIPHPIAWMKLLEPYQEENKQK